MDLVISQLDRKYQEFLDALDRKSFYNIFRCVYEYFDIIQSQKDLQKIIAIERQEIEDKKKVVNSDEKLTARDKKETIRRIEDQSYSFGYNKINERIYLPMKNYKESLTLSPKELLTGRALSVKDQSKNVGEYLTDIFFSSVFGDIEPAKVFWTKFKYLCFTDNVAVYMEKLRSGLIKKKLELPVIEFKEEKSNDKIRIVIDNRKGIYRKTDKGEFCYTIKNPSSRFTVINSLQGKERVKVSEMEMLTGQEDKIIRASIKGINKLFRKMVDVPYDLILHLGTGGYSLNTDQFDIRINE